MRSPEEARKQRQEELERLGALVRKIPSDLQAKIDAQNCEVV